MLLIMIFFLHFSIQCSIYLYFFFSYKDEVNRRMTDRLVNAVIASEGGMEKSSWPLREIEGTG